MRLKSLKIQGDIQYSEWHGFQYNPVTRLDIWGLQFNPEVQELECFSTEKLAVENETEENSVFEQDTCSSNSYLPEIVQKLIFWSVNNK